MKAKCRTDSFELRPNFSDKVFTLFEGKIYFGTDCGYFISSDDGITWNSLIDCNNHNNFDIGANTMSSDIIFIDSNIYFSNYRYGVVCSRDKGKTWNSCIDDMTYKHYIRLFYWDKKFIFYTPNKYRYYISTDFCNSWNLLSENNYYQFLGICNNAIFFTGYNAPILYVTYDYFKSIKSYEFNQLNPDNYHIDQFYITDLYCYVHITANNGNGSYFYRAKLCDCMIDTTSTDVEELEVLENDFSLAPNPASDYVEIKPSKGLKPSEGSEIRIYNALGECVLAESIHPMTRSHRMNIEFLPAGVYYIKTGTQTKMFVKM